MAKVINIGEMRCGTAADGAVNGVTHFALSKSTNGIGDDIFKGKLVSIGLSGIAAASFDFSIGKEIVVPAEAVRVEVSMEYDGDASSSGDQAKGVDGDNGRSAVESYLNAMEIAETLFLRLFNGTNGDTELTDSGYRPARINLVPASETINGVVVV